MTKCAVCGKPATNKNKQGAPVCARCQKKKVNAPSCPACGSQMVLRNGKYGSFWGCSMYPECMETKKLGE